MFSWSKLVFNVDKLISFVDIYYYMFLCNAKTGREKTRVSSVEKRLLDEQSRDWRKEAEKKAGRKNIQSSSKKPTFFDLLKQKHSGKCFYINIILNLKIVTNGHGDELTCLVGYTCKGGRGTRVEIHRQIFGRSPCFSKNIFLRC